jgi:hypothetical protein
MRLFLAAVAVIAAGAAVAGSVARAAGTEQPAACAPRTPIELPLNPWPAAAHELAPPGASAIRLCRYNGFNGPHARALASSALVGSSRAVAALVSELDALKPQSSRVFCPMDDGVEIDLLLGYRSGQAVHIRVEPTGCETVTNGRVTRTAATTAAGTKLLATIEQLTGYRASTP